MNLEIINRPKDATLKIINYLDNILWKPFEWGETHCTALVFGCIDAVYETDFFKWHKETHNVKTEKDALKLCKSKATLKFFNENFMEVDLYSIKIGDVIYVDEDGYECCHIFSGRGFVSSELNGFVKLMNYQELISRLKDNNYKVFRWNQ